MKHYFKKFFKKMSLCFIAVIFTASVWAQQKSIRGSVTDKSGLPLPGVTVVVIGTTTGTITNANGEYSIANIPSEAVLEFSFVGFKTQEIVVGTQTQIDVVMEEDVIGIEEVVVIGYGTQKKEEITSAISKVTQEDFVKGPVTNPLQLLAGKVAGLAVNRPSGDPTQNPEIMLRGVNSLLGNSSPLIVVDGVQNVSINSIQPENIESITILKDASAAAIYGSQASGGVVIITTKSGKGVEGVEMNYSGWVGFESLANKPDFLAGDEYRAFYEEQQANNFVNFPRAKDMIDYEGNTNWIDAVTQRGFTQSHNISVAGGWNKSSFSGSATYRDQEGVIITSRAKTFTTRLNFNTKVINDRLTIGTSVLNTAFDNTPVPLNTWSSVLGRNPTIPLHKADGSYFEDPSLSGVGASPVANLRNREAQDKSNTLLINTNAVLNIGWGFKTGLQYGWQRWNQNSGSYTFVNSVTAQPGTAQISDAFSTQRTLDYTLEYSKSFALHNVNAITGYSYQDYSQRNNYILNSGFFNNLFLWNNIGAGTSIGTGITPGRSGIGSGGFDSKLIAFFGRVNYNYNNKYLLSASLRREGSSVFGPENQWGMFPAVSLGWVISQEGFMDNVKLFSQLKLRAGYGVTGTQPRNVTVTQNTIAPAGAGLGNRFYNEGNWNTIAYAPIENYNPFLKWESNKELNIGLDFNFTGDRISGSLDFYNKKIENMIYTYNVATPPNIFNTSVLNVGSMQNTGIELLLKGAIVKQKDFILNSILTFSYNSNKVLSLSNEYNKLPYADVGYIGDIFQTNTHRLVEGEAVGNFWGYTFKGIDDQGHWILDSDIDGNATKSVIGNGIPKYTGGLTIAATYKNFDLSFLVRGSFKFQVLDLYRLYYENKFQVPGNILRTALDLPLYEIPKYSSYYVENGDYLKLDNLTLGYTITPRSGALKSVRLYVSGLNLLTISGYKGLDPEVNISGLTPGIEGTPGNTQINPAVFQIYPKTRIVNAGLIVEF